jgi:hypothetical protein
MDAGSGLRVLSRVAPGLSAVVRAYARIYNVKLESVDDILMVVERVYGHDTKIVIGKVLGVNGAG